jgi:putative peptide zinc metalloprotease protein
MNLAEVLNVALPELPARRGAKSNPRLHPRLIAHEQMKDGIPTMVAMVSGGTGSVFFFTPEQWKMVGLFNGEHSYREIAEAYTAEIGLAWSEEDVRAFADQLDDAGLFYKTALDVNSTASQKLTEERRRRTHRKIDVSQMTFSTWDPDSYLTKLHDLLSFAYTKWFTLFTLSMFTIMALIFLTGWSEVWRDTTEYYTFTHKGAADLAEFWLLFCGLGFFHESAHGLTCKHFGGGVHRMGFMLIYLSPAFFVDITEIYVYGGKWQRVASIIAGIWVELMFCSAASIIWWGTPLGSPIHDFAYKIMLITGVAVVLMNLNPLIRLDGYYLFGELVGVTSLKENSTEYLSSWVKRNLFRMPVEVPYVRARRRWLFAGYAVLSGLYSYIILFAVIHFAYNIFLRISPQWAFLPALTLALLIFRARLRSSARFMKDFYLDKRQNLRAWSTVPRRAMLGATVVLALFAPVWRETVTGRFVLEPEQRAVIRATVPGKITEVLTEEGSPIAAGAPVVRMRNAKLEQEADRSLADLSLAEANTRQAQLNYADLGRARSEQASQLERHRAVFQQLAGLQIVSPISGVVMTPRIRSLAGSFVTEGTELAEVADIQRLRAHIFIPDFEIRRVAIGAQASLKPESEFLPIRGRVASISPATLELEPGLRRVDQYKGSAPPPYYVATVPVPNLHGMIGAGTSGDAKIMVRWRSSAWFLWENLREFVQRKTW